MNSATQNQELMLKESIQHFLELHQKGSSDFSFFETIFFRLIQTMLDPPVEITWFYSAVTFHAAKSSSQNKDLSARVLRVKDLLNLLISCSNLSSTSKKIVLLAPVVYELYNVLYDFEKIESNVKYEVNNLLENITDHIILFAGIHDYRKGHVEFENMAVDFEDLVRVWTADRGGGSRSVVENLTLFFPVLSDCIWRGVNLRHGLQEFVGIVLCEVFLLKLCLSFGSGQSKEEFLIDRKNHAVRIIMALSNCFFADILFKTLLEPTLPVKTLLCSTDEILLRKVLYDAVVLIDYSFYFGRWSHSPDNQPKKLSLLWLLVADKAIRFALTANDFATVISYINAFAKSQIVTEIIKWAKLQAGIEDPIDRFNVQHPQVLIVFDEESLVVANESMFEARINFAPNFINLSSYAVSVNKDQEIGDAFDVNNGLEIDDVSSFEDTNVNEVQGIGADPWGTAHSFGTVEAESSKKRKEAFLSDVNDPQPKHAKHGDSPGSLPAGDDQTCGTSYDDMAEV
ncbi:hypothetical protein F511_16448 [Dorcoceras hygrometricum]|uniref:Uncharacterized protein n=1 Tax=Dorcoceras hygrometricum TaxID=472368 RepID=A0A2Z7BSA9_9LAMI|nr:hypothetical protein F511_16448 [Dorcoceras hygrometricum]